MHTYMCANQNRIRTCEAVFNLTDLIFSFSLWRTCDYIRTAEVTIVCKFVLPLQMIFFAGDSACFHCVCCHSSPN